jgi:hypothetical protein
MLFHHIESVNRFGNKQNVIINIDIINEDNTIAYDKFPRN